jgi:acetyl esterase/lipase
MSKHNNLSDQAKSILAGHPFRYSDRSESNLGFVRSQTRTFIEPFVHSTKERYQTNISKKQIAGVSCLIIRPSNHRIDCRILYCFGGGFVSGSAFEDLTIAIPIAAFTNSEVIIPEYRLAPEHPWPAAPDDVFKVYNNLVEKPCVLVGESAGANLALCVALRAKRLNLTKPISLALFSPWCNLGSAGASLVFNNGRDPYLSAEQSKMAAHHYLGSNNSALAESSPVFGAFDSTFPPCLITTGTRDLLLSQSLELAHNMRANDVKVDLRVWDELWHVFEWDPRLPESELSLLQVSEFIKTSLDQVK